jgi:hydroxyethylthiazole kinase-like uncharacterized protein yjeF
MVDYFTIITAAGGHVKDMDIENSACLLSAEQSRALDVAAIDLGVSGIELMRSAGRAVADILSQYIGTPLEAGGPIIVLCGSGNNGGDGFVAAKHLAEWGYKVSLRCVCEISELSGDAAIAASEWLEPITLLSVTDSIAGFEEASAIVDCIFGTGLNKPVTGDLADLIEAVNGASTFKLAVDLPSGLPADSGCPEGACIAADATITFNLRKPAHLIAPGRFLCGGVDNIYVAQIGVPNKAFKRISYDVFANIPALWGQLFPFSGPQTHKYNRGHMLVLGGREPTLGASRLASLAGLRVGAGLVTLAAPTDTYTVQASALMDVLVRRFDSTFGFMGVVKDPRVKTVLIGPGAGLSEKTAELVQQVGETNKGVVLDADALSSLAGRTNLIKDFKSSEVVLTPHEGEFSRLWPDLDINNHRISAVRTASASISAIVVLKGVSTLVAAPDGRVCICDNAPSWLSVGGTGDVLSGIICGLMTQGMPAFEAAAAGVWIHSAAGMKAGRGLIASDLLDQIPKVLP